MKRQITASIFISLSLLLLLASFTSTAHGQQPRRFASDTGIIPLGEDQVLRITVNGLGGNDTINVRFRRIGYAQGSCDSGVCIQTIAAQTTSDSITLTAGEGASIDIPSSFIGGVFVGVRGVVLTSSQEVKVTVLIIDTATGKVVAMLGNNGPFSGISLN